MHRKQTYRLHGVLLAFLGTVAPGQSGIVTRSDVAWAQTGPSIERLQLLEPPRPEAPLGVRVDVATSEPARLFLEVADGERTERMELAGEYRTTHIVPLVGLRPGRTHAVTFTATDTAGNTGEAATLTIETDQLPDDFPPLDVTSSRPEHMEPGVTLLSVYRWGEEGRDLDFGLLVAVDSSGDVVWYYRAQHSIGVAVPLASGNLLYRASVDGVWSIHVEIDLLGNVVRRWHSRGLADRATAGSILIDVDSLHHEMVELPSGNLLTLGSEVRTFADYPTSEEDPGAPRGPREVIGDVVLELEPDGAIVERWPLLDVLDPYRIGYDSFDMVFWRHTYRALGRPVGEMVDWAHANAVSYDARDDTFVVSLRNQDALVKLDRTGTLRWILGPHAGWTAPWRARLLEPQGELEWPYHGHGGEVTPDGTILLFDNGKYRATPFDAPMPADESYSRAVEFQVDESTMSVRQRWAYPPPGADRFYSSFLGDADWLPHTGNVLITDGARVRTMPDTADGQPLQRRWARILEVTRDDPAAIVFMLVLDDESPTGWHVYRASRWQAPLIGHQLAP